MKNMSNYKVTVDYTPAYEQGGGIGRYVRELVHALSEVDPTNEYRLFVSGCAISPLKKIGDNFKWATTRVSQKWLARLWHRARIPLPVEAISGSTDLFHATDFVLPPTQRKTRTILTVHDLSFIRTPETAKASLRRYLETVVPRSLRRATHVLADSQSTKDDLVDIYGVKPESVSVLLSGVDSRFKPSTLTDTMREKYFIPNRPYVLAVGTVQPRKNYARLVHALAELHQMGIDVSLVIAGGKGWLEDEIYEAVNKTGLRNFVRFTGFVDDADLPALYSDAVCTAFPSLYEGFGLPVLESMACKTPVLTSNVSSLPEVAGDAALLVDPHDVGEISVGMYRLITDDELRRQLIQRGANRIVDFSWQQTARELTSIYERVLNL